MIRSSSHHNIWLKIVDIPPILCSLHDERHQQWGVLDVIIITTISSSLRRASSRTMVKVILTVELGQLEGQGIAEAVKAAAALASAAANRCETGTLRLNGSWSPWDMQVPADSVITFVVPAIADDEPAPKAKAKAMPRGSVLTGIHKKPSMKDVEPEAKRNKSSSSGDKFS